MDEHKAYLARAMRNTLDGFANETLSKDDTLGILQMHAEEYHRRATTVEFSRQPSAEPRAPKGNCLLIELEPHEVQSGVNRLQIAEGLIRQLPATHDGRNTWLMNFGTDAMGDAAHVLVRQKEFKLRNGFAYVYDENKPGDLVQTHPIGAHWTRYAFDNGLVLALPNQLTWEERLVTVKVRAFAAPKEGNLYLEPLENAPYWRVTIAGNDFPNTARHLLASVTTPAGE